LSSYLGIHVQREKKGEKEKYTERGKKKKKKKI
jgi:hypothetical protein